MCRFVYAVAGAPVFPLLATQRLHVNRDVLRPPPAVRTAINIVTLRFFGGAERVGCQRCWVWWFWGVGCGKGEWDRGGERESGIEG